jgi:hypothetical protein
MSGGPFVNGPVKYYETNYATQNVPVHFSMFGDFYRFLDSSNSVIPNTSVDYHTLGELSSGTKIDYFLIESFHDADGAQVLIIYGYQGYGTFAGALYFKTVLFPSQGGTLVDGYRIVKWTDTGGNGLPDTSDSYETIANVGYTP